MRIYHFVIYYKQQKEPFRLEVGEARKGGDGIVSIWSQDRSLRCEDETGVSTGVNKHWLRAPAVQSSTRRIFSAQDKSRLPTPLSCNRVYQCT